VTRRQNVDGQVALRASCSYTTYHREWPASKLAEDRRQSFINLHKWLTDCRALASPHLIPILIGNKVDREDEREVEYAEGSRWAQENGLLFVEVSSLTGENVLTPFLLAARTILEKIDSGEIDPDQAGTGISYGERQLRAVGSQSRLSTFGSRKKRNRTVTLGDMVGQRRCTC
jgi:Ras-related protein Rab-4B